MASTITLNRPGVCKQCGTELAIGTKARYYGRAGMYGLDCHEDTRSAKANTTAVGEPVAEGQIDVMINMLKELGVYTAPSLRNCRTALESGVKNTKAFELLKLKKVVK